MCGIVGYVGDKSAIDIVLEGLKRLEYRGYDSAGVALIGPGGLQIRRAAGRIKVLEGILRDRPVEGTVGIGHTRWATHGRPTDENAHPHTDGSGNLVVVHNGIIENYLPIKEQLQAEGHTFASDTDTEVIAHLIERHLKDAPRLEDAVRRALRELRGSYAVVVLSKHAPDRLIAAKHGAGSVVVGLGQGETYLASDIPAILSHTRDVVIPEDEDIAVVTRNGVEISQLDGTPVQRAPLRILWDPIMAEKGGYRHFMLKEIYEQPRAVRETALGRMSLDSGKVFLDEMEISEAEFKNVKKINIAACGTSWHAGLAGKFMIERLDRVPVEVDYASEYRYRDPITGTDTLTLLITQSGETADTIAAQREAKAKGSKTLAICNVVGAMIAREAAGTIYTHAGPEIGVASTKAFTAQLTALFLFALFLAQKRNGLSEEQSIKLVQELTRLPGKLEALLNHDEACDDLAKRYQKVQDFLFLGRGIHYPIALEGALKLKEISYIHAEGYPAGEMKHGPNALIDENLPVVVLATKDPHDADSVLRYEKTMSNIKEVTARSGKVIAIATEGDNEIHESADHVLYVPKAPELLLPILEVVPLQLLAYHIAVRRGCDVDQPRNLAKSVTVE